MKFHGSLNLVDPKFKTLTPSLYSNNNSDFSKNYIPDLLNLSGDKCAI